MNANGLRQRAHRERRATERQAMIEALRQIVVITAPAQKEMGRSVHDIALKALGEGR